MLIKQQAHKFRHGQSRMGVVDMHGRTARQFDKTVMSEMIPQNALQPCRYKEILLLEAQDFAVSGGVIRVEDIGYGFNRSFGINSALAVAATRSTGQMADGRFGAPQAQFVDSAVLITESRNVIGNSVYGFTVAVRHSHRLVRMPVFPDITPFLKPVVGVLHLIAVNDSLLEKPVTVPQTAAVAGKAHGCHAIQITGRQAAQSAIADTGVLFLIFQSFQSNAHVR